VKFKLDENVSAEAARALALRGYDVDTVASEGLAGKLDPDVVAAATRAGRVLVTQDLDFADIRQYRPGTHPGLILLRLRTRGRTALLRRVEQIAGGRISPRRLAVSSLSPTSRRGKATARVRLIGLQLGDAGLFLRDRLEDLVAPRRWRDRSELLVRERHRPDPCGSLRGFGRVLTHAARFHDPQLLVNARSRKRFGESPHEIVQRGGGCLRGGAKHRDSRVAVRWKSDRVREVQVECHEAATLASGGLDQGLVTRRRHGLLHDGRDLVAGSPEDGSTPATQILIELELHAGGRAGMST
jgi:predicted nuclease of predicted toxin-antitoxin system